MTNATQEVSLSQGAFGGLRVIDFTNGFAGSLATMIMADNGAAVIRIVPEGLQAEDFSVLSQAAVQWHRGKDLRVVDFGDDGQRKDCLVLVSEADVLVESYGQERMAAFGLSWEELHSANPGLCYFTVDSFGDHPSLGSVPAHEGLVHAAAGRMADFGRTFGLSRPAFSSSPVAGFGAAQAIVQGVCAALHEREVDDADGRYMRTSLARCLTPFDVSSWAQVQFPDTYPQPPANDYVFLPYIPARALDGVWLQFACYAPHLFWQLAATLGLGALRDEPRFAELPGRVDPEDAHAFWEKVLTAVATKTSTEWMELFTKLGTVGVDIVRHTQSGMDHPQARFNGDVLELNDSEHGTTLELGPIAHMEATPSPISATAKSWEGSAGHRVTRSATPRNTRGLPLEGVLVVESAAYVAAPLAPVLLSDLGARVIKLEPLEGDPLRGMLGLKLMQGKESVAVDLKTPEGMELAQRILAKADIFIHNYRPGVPERLGIDYATVSALNPGIVYLYAGAYGATGPFSGMPAFHPIAGAICGNAALQVGQGHLDAARDWDLAALKEVSLRLGRANEGHPDMVSGCAYATAMMLGLLARDRFGTGQSIVATMLGANAYLMSDDWIQFEGHRSRRLVDADLLGTSSLNRLYPTADGWVFLAVHTEREWSLLCTAFAASGLGADPRFATPQSREENDEALAEVLERTLLEWTADELELRAAGWGLGCVRADRGGFGQYQQRDATQNLGEVTQPAWHRDLGPYWRQQGLVDFGPLDGLAKSASALGEHTDAVMAELGYTLEERRSLIERGIVRAEGAHTASGESE